jgi:DNA-binding transcriptional LysR family regulator
MLDNFQLQVFLAVTEEGSYTAAARRLHMTQPAVSRHMRLLQDQLGVRLFRRVGRRMVPTHAGERLLETARQMLALAQRVEEEMAVLRGEVTGVLRVGGSGTPACYVLAQLVQVFRVTYPGVGFSLESLPTEGVGRAVREGRLDLVIAEEEFPERGLESDLLVEMETMMIAPPGGRWERRKRLYLRTLPEVSLILPAIGTPARRFLVEYLTGRDVLLPSPLQSLEVNDPGAVLPLVAAGLGAALVPRLLVEAAPNLVHTITLWPSFPWPLYLTRRSTPTGRVEEVFLNFVLEEGLALLG